LGLPIAEWGMIRPFDNGCFWRVSHHRRNAGGRRLKLDLLGHIWSASTSIPRYRTVLASFVWLHCAQVTGLAINPGSRGIEDISEKPMDII
jgi:hypothetical protein